MAVVTGTFTTATPVGNRENLSDIISMITPRDTPVYSDIAHPSVDRAFFEWEIDTLNAPVANTQLEGDVFTFAAVSPVTRVAEYAQILRKDWSISGSQESSDNAGDAEKRKRVQLKRGIEIRKDVELSIISNVASVGGQTRVSGGLPSWLVSNVSRGAAGARWEQRLRLRRKLQLPGVRSGSRVLHRQHRRYGLSRSECQRYAEPW